MKTSKQLYNIVVAALFAAMIFVLTFYTKFYFTTSGYIHLGDAAIYLAASMLPTPYAVGAAAIGGGLSDFIGGYGVFVPITMVVKALLALCFSCKKNSIINVRNIIAAVICCIITVGGYFAFEIFYEGAGAFAELIPNLIQAVASGVIYVVIGLAFDAAKIKNKLMAYNK
ncbi:MAG: TIGR04002 family protein [Ruminococcus sp.]|nr:TIGR04002 family protein [Ruminococcus sp.]MDD6532327.1 TIGR04002 family protein [Ruminococcus sp.]